MTSDVPDIFDTIAAPKRDIFDDVAQSFDTPVPFDRVSEFQKWTKRYAPPSDSGDYDYGGAFLAGVTPNAEGHWPDTFKKPNHPTFSDESKYARDAPNRAGHWDGETFTPHRDIFDSVAADQPAEIAQSEAQQQIERNTTGSLADLKTGLDKAMMIPGKILGTGANLAATGFPRIPTDDEVAMPTVTPEQIAAVMPHTWFQKAIEAVAPNTPVQEAVTGLGRGMNTTAAGLTSLQNASLLGLAPEGKLAQRLIAGTFLGQSLLGTPEQWQAFKEAKSLEEKVKIGTEMGLGIALPTAGLLHANARAGEVPKVEVKPSEVPPIPEPTADRVPPQAVQDRPAQPSFPVESQPSAASDVQPQKPVEVPLPQPDPSTSSAQREAEKAIGITSAFSDIGKGVSDNFYAAAFDSLSKGKDTISGVRDPILAKAKPFYDAGLITSPADFKDLVQSGKIDKAPSVLEPNVAGAPPVSKEESGIKEANVSTEPAPRQNTPPEIQPTARNVESSETTGIAQAVHDKRAVDVEPGAGVGAEEMVNRGRQLVAEGVDPVAKLQEMKATGRINADDIAVLRARHEELGKATNAAEDVIRANPSDPLARKVYEGAWKAENDWAKEIKPFQTEWHKIGMAQQGETNLDTGSFTGIRRAINQEKGRDLRPHEVPQVRKVVDAVQRATQAEAAARERLSQAVEQITKRRKPKTADELRTHFENRIKQLTPC